MSPFLPRAINILKLPELVPINLIVSDALFIEHLETLGVLMLPDVGNSLWNSSLKGVLDQGVDGYSFTWTYPQAHLVLSSDN